MRSRGFDVLKDTNARTEATLALIRRGNAHCHATLLLLTRTEQRIAESKRLLGLKRYRGFRIIACQQEGGWRAQLEGVGALSDIYADPGEAVGEIERYLDAVTAERFAAD